MKILVPLADGLEEIETVTCIDVLRRAGVNVTTAGLDKITIEGGHNINLEADAKLSEIDGKEYDGIVLPGGIPGATNLRDNTEVVKLVKELNYKGKLVAAICAAPIVLEKAGVIENKSATSYPGFDEQMNSCNYSEERVIRDNNIITGRGPGVALEFALQIVSYLQGENKKEELKEAMLAKF